MGGPYNKDYSILGSIFGFPYVGKLPKKFGIHLIFLAYFSIRTNVCEIRMRFLVDFDSILTSWDVVIGFKRLCEDFK